MIKIYNSLSNKLENFIPYNNLVKMYICGPTTYNYIHLGNARPIIFFDVVRRYLEYKGYKVKYIQNFTDIDDKIIKVAHAQNVHFKEISNLYIDEYFKDAEALNVKRATVHPKATESINKMIEIIESLLNQKIAYIEQHGIYFKIKHFKEYGKLSKQNLNFLEEGHREIKNFNHEDFVLWKFEKEESISWDSPWGRGRPGWHIECSAMISENLGEQIDIHCGGEDLKFPHHENEIAQSEAFTGKILAKYWMHNSFINTEDNKMSKSLGNAFLVRDLLKNFDGNILRPFILLTHYRKPINFSIDKLGMLNSSYHRIENFVFRIKDLANNNAKGSFNIKEIEGKLIKDFEDEMNNDFNSAGALGVLFENIRILNSILDKELVEKKPLESFIGTFLNLLSILGLEIKEKKVDLDSLINLFINIRNEARENKNWALADKIRDELLKLGIILEDKKEVTTWKIY